jgi:glucose/arabinose dehydrogenase
MKRLLTLLASVIAVASQSFAALAELNPADNTISSPDGTFIGRDFTVIDGFKLELLHVTDLGTEGQWVALAWDNRGRLIVPTYTGTPRIARLTIPNAGSSDPVRIEMIQSTPEAPIYASEGILYAFDSLYFNANRGGTTGTFRMRDTNGDDVFDESRVIRTRAGDGSDHGTHTLQLTPDGQMISVISGNATRLSNFNRSRVPVAWGEDNLVMRPDLSPPGFHRAPEAHIMNFNADGSIFEIWSIGMRNPVSHAYNKDGELFVYDADEEPNMGFTVGYRPTTIIHATSGSDAGWRSGSKVHPFHRFDFFGTIGVVGSGSPVGSGFGTGTKFPARYQDAFFIADWSFGNLWAVMLTPDGSSYQAVPMPFVSGRPFAVSGIISNPADGSLLVMTTGTQLYRITYVGNESTAPTAPDTRYQAMRELRHGIERYHGAPSAGGVAAVWPYLSDDDRAIRYAARTALEWQEIGQWRERALTENDPRKAIAAIASLARMSGRDEYHTAPDSPARDKALQSRMLAALNRIPLTHLTYQDKLDLVRAYQLTMIRMGRPSDDDAARVIARLDPLLPGQHQELNREVAEVLVYLEAPSAATKVMALLRTAPDNPYYGIQEWINPQQRQRQDRGEVTGANIGIPQATLAKQDAEIFYAQLLRVLHAGWTPELRREYMSYYTTAPATYYGTTAALGGLRIDAISQIPESERAALQDLIDEPMPAGFGRAGGGGGGRGAALAGGPGAAPGGPGGPAAAPGAVGRGGGRGAAGTPGIGAPATNLFIGTNGRGGLTDLENTAVVRVNEGAAREMAARDVASTALVAASLTIPADPATLAARASQVANAERALAEARSDSFTRVMTQMSIPADRIPDITQAVATGRGGGGGRGGRGGFGQ